MNTNWKFTGKDDEGIGLCRHGSPPGCRRCSCLNLTEDELTTLGTEDMGFIRAIKKVRERTGLSLKDAKEAVEEDALRMGLYTEATRSIGFRGLDRRENPDTIAPAKPESPEVAYLRKWLHYYENWDKAPKGCMDVSKPDGIDPTTVCGLGNTIVRAQAILNERRPMAKKMALLRALLKGV